MIDLHCHILPGIDDGAADISVSLAMARAMHADGVLAAACTPHIHPGIYHNTGPQIRRAVCNLQSALDAAGIGLVLTTGADVHIAPDLVQGIESGAIPTISRSRYILIEPPHHVAPIHLESIFFSLLVAGYVPILTHPERLAWIGTHIACIRKLVKAGVWLQLTAGSLLGAFGKTAHYWSERLLDEGCVHILASDAHDCSQRPPCLGRGRDAAAKRVGAEEAIHLVLTRPRGIITNLAPSSLPPPAGLGSSPWERGEHEERIGYASRRGWGEQLSQSFVAHSHDGIRQLSRRLRGLLHQ